MATHRTLARHADAAHRQHRAAKAERDGKVAEECTDLLALEQGVTATEHGNADDRDHHVRLFDTEAEVHHRPSEEEAGDHRDPRADAQHHLDVPRRVVALRRRAHGRLRCCRIDGEPRA